MIILILLAQESENFPYPLHHDFGYASLQIPDNFPIPRVGETFTWLAQDTVPTDSIREGHASEAEMFKYIEESCEKDVWTLEVLDVEHQLHAVGFDKLKGRISSSAEIYLTVQVVARHGAEGTVELSHEDLEAHYVRLNAL